MTLTRWARFSRQPDIARNAQIGLNLDRVKSEADGSEQALSAAIATLERISVLGAREPISTSAGARGLAIEVQNLLERLVVRQFQRGRAIRLQRRLHQVGVFDRSDHTDRDYPCGAAATHWCDSRGGTFSTSQSAQQIFDAPASVFAAVNALRTALLRTTVRYHRCARFSAAAHDHVSDS
jgi:hypothetical protein